jgi:hypothetical protein
MFRVTNPFASEMPMAVESASGQRERVKTWVFAVLAAHTLLLLILLFANLHQERLTGGAVSSLSDDGQTEGLVSSAALVLPAKH